MRRPLFPLIAVLLVSLAGCSPQGRQEIGAAALDQVARAAFRQETAISAAALSDRLVERTGNFVLIDLRPPEAFAAGHIDTALQRNLPELVASEGRRALPAGKDVILYGSDSAAGAQAATLLRIAGWTNAYYLSGGYESWLAHLRGEPASPQAKAKRAAVACYFEGDYVAEAGLVPRGASGPGYAPEVQPATPPADALGLGLGLGLGPESAQPPVAAPPAPADNLGLGLGLGLGPDTPAPKPAAPGRLNIGEGC